MPTISKGDKVLVTGANGYIAVWLVRQLLEKGYAVRGTVRSEQKGEYVKNYLEKLGLADKFELFIVEDIEQVCVMYQGVFPFIDFSFSPEPLTRL